MMAQRWTYDLLYRQELEQCGEKEMYCTTTCTIRVFEKVLFYLPRICQRGLLLFSYHNLGRMIAVLWCQILSPKLILASKDISVEDIWTDLEREDHPEKIDQCKIRILGYSEWQLTPGF